MCDVLFITPNGTEIVEKDSMGTFLLATILKENGINVQLTNFSKFNKVEEFDKFLDGAVDVVEEIRPQIISFYTRCDVYHIELRMAQKIKEKFNDVYIVFGGPQSDITAEETIRTMPQVDFICCGEGEQTIVPFFKSLLQKSPDVSIDGLVYRDGNAVVKNPRPELLEDLDVLPIIDYTLSPYGEVELNNYFPIEVGRGCPFACTFCSTKSFWGRKYRLKSSQRIIDEIKALNKKWGITHFGFTHDMFTFNRKNVIEICGLLKQLDFEIKWSCSARLDCLDPELIDIMVDAGMRSIYLGIETGSPRMQKLVNKRLKIENAFDIIEHLDSKNILITTSFIYGFPEETEEDVEQTIAFIVKLINMKNVEIQAHLCAFLPATELTEKYKDLLTSTEQHSNIIGNFAVKECKPMLDKYPQLFEQMLEYKTDLRAILKHFEVFIQVWEHAKHAYNYISEIYGEGNLFKMYCDFAEANKEALDSVDEFLTSTATNKILVDDKFIARFTDDENYDILADFSKLQRMLQSDEVKNGGTSMDIICFDVNCIEKCASIRDYEKGKYMVFCNNGKFACASKK